MKVTISIIEDRYLENSRINYFDVKVEYEDQIYRTKEMIEPDVMSSMFDRIFERAKLSMKECIDKKKWKG